MFGFRLNPRNEIFFDILERATAQVVETARLLCDMLNDYTDLQVKLQRLIQSEKKADAINHEIVQQLSKSFITPIDREDLHTLAYAVDDIVDSLEAAGTTMVLCKIPQPTVYSIKMANMALDAAAKLNTLMPNLRSMRSGQGQYIAIHEIENQADELWQQAFASLFEPGSDALDAIKWKEVYQKIEDSIDAIERVAEIIEEVIQKNG